MDVSLLTALAAALTAVVGTAYSVYLMVREGSTLRRIERLTDIVGKLEPDAEARNRLTQVRDSLIARYFAAQTNRKRTSLRFALAAVGFYLGGFACFGISASFAFTPSWTVLIWLGIALLVVGMILISLAERKLSEGKPSTDERTDAVA